MGAPDETKHAHISLALGAGQAPSHAHKKKKQYSQGGDLMDEKKG